MTKITFEDHTGQCVTVEAKLGSTIMEVAIQNNVAGIVAECGGACACATCHVYVDPGWMDTVGPPGESERDMLEFANGVRENSRLSCQLKVREAFEGLIVRTPAEQG
ncbi:2Fe-2S iron-sulfur cluster-binding protein [Cupriavidus sp. 8B]